MILGDACLHRIVHLTKSALSKLPRQRTSARLVPKRTLYNATKVLFSSTSSSSAFPSSFVRLKSGGALDAAKKAQVLMRQIYSRVHPDLFTNHSQARVCAVLSLSYFFYFLATRPKLLFFLTKFLKIETKRGLVENTSQHCWLVCGQDEPGRPVWIAVGHLQLGPRHAESHLLYQAIEWR